MEASGETKSTCIAPMNLPYSTLLLPYSILPYPTLPYPSLPYSILLTSR